MSTRWAGWVLVVVTTAACGGAQPVDRKMEVGEARPAAAATPAPTPAPTTAPVETATPAEAAPAEPAAPPAQAAAPSPAETVGPDLAESPGAPELASGAEAVRKSEWVKARKQLGGAIEGLQKSGSIEGESVGRALLGRACVALKDLRCAERQFQAVMELWKDPAAARQRIEASGGDEAARRERLRRALLAVGEALFFAAEQKRAATESVRMPLYKGDGSAEAVRAFVATKVAGFIQTKRPMLEETERAYLRVLELEPSPPPRWVIASASQVGAMWGRFVAEFRAAPIPAEWKRQGTVPGSTMTYEELRHAYYSAIDEASEPIRARAQSAFEVCKRRAERFQHEDTYTQRCTTWLAKHAR